LAKIPEIFYASFDECWFDICTTGEIGEVCQHGKSLVDQCLQEHQVSVPNWREIHEYCGKIPQTWQKQMLLVNALLFDRTSMP
jgi:hypothetical protein